MSRAGDGLTQHDDRFACSRVCKGKRRREALVEIAATYRAISSIRKVELLMSSPDE